MRAITYSKYVTMVILVDSCTHLCVAVVKQNALLLDFCTRSPNVHTPSQDIWRIHRKEIKAIHRTISMQTRQKKKEN